MAQPAHGRENLLFLFSVPSVLTHSRTVLLDAQFLGAWFAFERVIDVVGFFTNQKDSFRLFFTAASHESLGCLKRCFGVSSLVLGHEL